MSPNWFLGNWTPGPSSKMGLMVFYCKTLLTPYVQNHSQHDWHLVQSANMLDPRSEALAYWKAITFCSFLVFWLASCYGAHNQVCCLWRNWGTLQSMARLNLHLHRYIHLLEWAFPFHNNNSKRHQRHVKFQLRHPDLVQGPHYTRSQGWKNLRPTLSIFGC